MPTQILWPILASMTAVALHWFINVPSKPYQERKPSSTVAIPKPKKTKSAPTTAHHRSPTRLRLLQNHWSSQPFANEPENKHFKSLHETVLQNFMVEVQNHAKIAPKTSNFTAIVKCKTVRCEFEICGTERQSNAFLAPLKNAQVDGRSTWRSFIETNNASATKKPNKTRDKHQDYCKFFVVSLTRDLKQNDSLTIPNPSAGHEKAKKHRASTPPRTEDETDHAGRRESEKRQSKPSDR